MRSNRMLPLDDASRGWRSSELAEAKLNEEEDLAEADDEAVVSFLN